MSDSIKSFEIRNCSSNKIQEVEWKSVDRKAIIRLDQDQIIGDPTTPFDDTKVYLTIWCESDSLIRKCSLEHDSKDTINAACEAYIPLPCKQNLETHTCHPSYENIKIVQTSNYRCEFQFSMIRKKGKN